MRFDNWKFVFLEQRTTGTLAIWLDPYVELRAPKIYNLRTDPYEKAEGTSNTYYDWMLDHIWLLIPAQTYVAQMLESLIEFPPRQTPATFSVDQVMAKLKAGIASRADMLVDLPGGTFTMGSDDHYPEEAPTHRVRVDAFSIDATAVTNAEFAAFVEATGYVTVAERDLDPADYPDAPAGEPAARLDGVHPHPRAGDLRHLSQWWRWKPGACWKHPQGPKSSIDERLDHPVVHVAHEDALAYATWAGAALPTEAEWEYAARGGLDGAAYTWGDEPGPAGRIMANTWDGPDFPWRSTGESGFLRTAPVGSFPPNGFGLFDMAGNVWEWTDDWWTSRHPDDAGSPCCAPENPRGGDLEASYDPRSRSSAIGRKVIKGGSHLCADTYCLRYRPAARRPQMIDTGMSHVGFRCVRRSPRSGRPTMHRRPASLLASRADPRRARGVPRRGRDVPAERAGGVLRQRRHAVVRAADVRAVRLLRRRAEERGGGRPRARGDARVRRAAVAATRPAIGEIGPRADRAGADRAVRGQLAGGVHRPGPRVHGPGHAPDARSSAAQPAPTSRCSSCIDALRRLDFTIAVVTGGGTEFVRGGQPGAVRRTARGASSGP